jgi:hypothetical protein
LLGVGQLLEIIFTLVTLNVGCDPPAPAPLAADEPAPPALDGLLFSDPLMRT